MYETLAQLADNTHRLDAALADMFMQSQRELRAARRSARAWKAYAKRKTIQLRQSQQAEFAMHRKLLRMESRLKQRIVGEDLAGQSGQKLRRVDIIPGLHTFDGEVPTDLGTSDAFSRALDDAKP